MPFEKIDIYNITNGERLTTCMPYLVRLIQEKYVLMAHVAIKIHTNDEVIICSYIDLSENEINNHKPTILHLNNSNKIVDKGKDKVKLA